MKTIDPKKKIVLDADVIIHFSIEYLTTMDFLAEAYRTGKMDEATCDFFIDTVKLKGSRLPCNSIAAFLALK